MREVFKPAASYGDAPLHDVFYTIVAEDVGKFAVIETTVGVIPVGQVLGRVLPGDVGKRLYAVLTQDKLHTVWEAENNLQRDERLRGFLFAPTAEHLLSVPVAEYTAAESWLAEDARREAGVPGCYRSGLGFMIHGPGCSCEADT
jgi:hypothetical protein